LSPNLAQSVNQERHENDLTHTSEEREFGVNFVCRTSPHYRRHTAQYISLIRTDMAYVRQLKTAWSETDIICR